MGRFKFMNPPVKRDITSDEIVDFYCRCGDKKQTAAVFCITVKDLNAILKGAKAENKMKDPYKEIGMSRKDF